MLYISRERKGGEFQPRSPPTRLSHKGTKPHLPPLTRETDPRTRDLGFAEIHTPPILQLTLCLLLLSSTSARSATLAAAMPSPSSSPSSTPSIPSTEEVKDEIVAASKTAVSSFRSLAAGGVGGVCAVVVGHPFDLVKVRMQTAEKGVYTGAIDVVKKTIAREGLRKVCGHQIMEEAHAGLIEGNEG